MKKHFEEMVASTFVTRTVPLVSVRRFVSLFQRDAVSNGLVEERICMPASRFESMAAPVAVRTVSWNLLAGTGTGTSSFNWGNDRSKQAPKAVLRTYTRPSATAGLFQHLLVSPK